MNSPKHEQTPSPRINEEAGPSQGPVEITELYLTGKVTRAHLEAQAFSRKFSQHQWVPLAEARWIMSIVPTDVDGDGDTDIVYSDRKGDERGCYWLENPAGAAVPIWLRHRIGTADGDAMFLDLATTNGSLDLVLATDRRELQRFQPTIGIRWPWNSTSADLPETFGTGKAVRLGDVNGDGTNDIVFSCENADGKTGVGWLSRNALGISTTHAISGTAGSKFDLVQLLDLDGDGDLDVVTTEESEKLGVVWYENPTIAN